VTEWETFYGFNLDKDRCYWMQRSFSTDALRGFKDNENCWKLTDKFENPSSAKKKLEFLQTKMKMYLKEDEQRCELFTGISPAIFLKNEGCEQYLQEWEKVARCGLEKELEKVIQKSKEWNVGLSGISVDHLEELVHHCSIAFTKAESFFGREELLQRAMEAVKTNSRESLEKQLFSGLTLVLVGKSGCGQTALMSKLALSSLNPAVPTIIRFCGTSKFSFDGLRLIQSISIQLLAAHGKIDELKSLITVIPSQDYKPAVKYFQNLISELPANLFIDSLDQLENRNEERNRLTFLRDIRPHEQSRILVSALPDEYDTAGKPGKYFYQCEKILRTGSVPLRI
jgi:hypothetical protein